MSTMHLHPPFYRSLLETLRQSDVVTALLSLLAAFSRPVPRDTSIAWESGEPDETDTPS